MQRIQLLSSPYSFSSTWVGAILFAKRRYIGDGWDVYFPHTNGNEVKWFHADSRVKLLAPIKRQDKPRYTLVPSLINKGERVWALLVPIARKNALDCPNCAFDKHVNECHASPPCSSHTRPDKRDIIFVTEVRKWGQ